MTAVFIIFELLLSAAPFLTNRNEWNIIEKTDYLNGNGQISKASKGNGAGIRQIPLALGADICYNNVTTQKTLYAVSRSGQFYPGKNVDFLFRILEIAVVNQFFVW